MFSVLCSAVPHRGRSRAGRVDDDPQPFEGAGRRALDRAHRTAHDLGHLRLGQVVEIAQHERHALAGRELSERPRQVGAALDPAEHPHRAVVRVFSDRVRVCLAQFVLLAGAAPAVFGSGRAVLSLRESYRHDLREAKRITDFEFIRFHAIFHDEVGLYDEDADGKPIYNFSYVDQIYDGLLQNGVRPYVELSFMPKKLAAEQDIHVFWYHPNVSPPKDWSKWSDMITQL